MATHLLPCSLCGVEKRWPRSQPMTKPLVCRVCTEAEVAASRLRTKLMWCPTEDGGGLLHYENGWFCLRCQKLWAYSPTGRIVEVQGPTGKLIITNPPITNRPHKARR